VYRTGDKSEELHKLTNVVFNKIDKAMVLAHKSKTLEDFESEILHPILFVQELMEEVYSRMPFLDAPEDPPKLLTGFSGKIETVYDRFFNKKKRKLKRRKNVRTKGKRS
jgi:hypothetical protein